MAEIKFLNMPDKESYGALNTALGLASTILGFKKASDDADQLRAKLDLEQKKLTQELSDKQTQEKRDVEGIFTKRQLFDKGFAPAPEQPVGKTPLQKFMFNVVSPDGTSAKQEFVKVQNDNPLLPLQVANLTGQISGRNSEEARKQKELEVPGYGSASTPKTATEANEALATHQTLSEILKDIKDLRQKYPAGSVLDRDAVTKAQSLAAQFITKFNVEAAKLGALSGPDKQFLNQIMKDNPLTVDPTVNLDAQLNEAQKALDRAATASLKKAGIRGSVNTVSESKKDVPLSGFSNDAIEQALQKKKAQQGLVGAIGK